MIIACRRSSVQDAHPHLSVAVVLAVGCVMARTAALISLIFSIDAFNSAGVPLRQMSPRMLRDPYLRDASRPRTWRHGLTNIPVGSDNGSNPPH